MNFFKTKKSVADSVEKELERKQLLVLHLKHTFAFLNPELSDDEIINKLLFTLTAMADPEILERLVSEMNELGIKKVAEVSDLYENFFNDNDNN